MAALRNVGGTNEEHKFPQGHIMRGSMVDIESVTTENRQGKKERR